MIDPKQFYISEDGPSGSEKEEVWSLLRQGHHVPKPFFFIRDRRSFLFGAAAMLAFLFVFAGLFAVYQNAVDMMRSPEGKLDHAYENALEELDQALPVVVVSSFGNEGGSDLLVMRQKQVHTLDGSIENVRSMLKLDPQNKSLKLELLQLYNLKLQFLLQIAIPPSETVSR